MLYHHSLLAPTRALQKTHWDTPAKISTATGTLGHPFTGNGKCAGWAREGPTHVQPIVLASPYSSRWSQWNRAVWVLWSSPGCRHTQSTMIHTEPMFSHQGSCTCFPAVISQLLPSRYELPRCTTVQSYMVHRGPLQLCPRILHTCCKRRGL